MRVESWNPNLMDETFENVAIERLVEAAEVVATSARQKLKGQIGQGVTTGISRPVYKKGAYKGRPWTKRDFGALLKSIRVTQKKTAHGTIIWKKRNVRVYCGNFLVYYARIFEFFKPFIRPALIQSISQIRSIIGVR